MVSKDVLFLYTIYVFMCGNSWNGSLHRAILTLFDLGTPEIA